MKHFKEILLFIGVALFLMHIPFDDSFQRADIFLLYDYPGEGRYIANILKELGMYSITFIFAFILWIETKKRFYLCFLLWWIYNVITYLLFYGQNTSIIGIPFLFIIIILVYAKARPNS